VRPVAYTTTTAVIAEAAGVTGKTVRVWASRGLLPAPKMSYRGRRGTVALWPDTAVAQAVWVRGQLEAGRTIPEIAEDVSAGRCPVSAER
jgi:hypothetical protein